MEVVVRKNLVEASALRELIAEGKVVIPANKNHPTLTACGIGQGLKTKINVNLINVGIL